VQVIAQNHREQWRPGGGCGVVIEYGPPAPIPKSEVPTAFPAISVNCVGAAGFPLENAW
jgi:hypothetical protein